MWAGNPAYRRRRTGFSLVEVLISLTLLMIMMLALISSYVFIARGDQSLANYGLMSNQGRALIEKLGQDLRMARTAVNFTATSLSVTLPSSLTDLTATQTVTWDYNSIAGTVTRTVGATVTTVATNVSACTFEYRNALGATTTSLVEVKQVLINLTMSRAVSSSAASNNVVSAQFTLRSKTTS